jgi:hypothetical protein
MVWTNKELSIILAQEKKTCSQMRYILGKYNNGT